MSLRTVLIIDDRKLKQMTKDLVMHLDLFAIENSKIKRLESYYHSLQIWARMLLSIRPNILGTEIAAYHRNFSPSFNKNLTRISC